MVGGKLDGSGEINNGGFLVFGDFDETGGGD